MFVCAKEISDDLQNGGNLLPFWVCQLNCVTLDCQELLGDNPKRLFLGKLGQGSMPCQSFSTLVA